MKKAIVHPTNQVHLRMTFSEWLRRQIDAYLAEKEPKGKRRKEKGERP